MDFQGAIQFKLGDLIKLESKYVTPGWYVYFSSIVVVKLIYRYTGTTNSRTGMFSIASVQLGFEDIPAIEEMGVFSEKKVEKNVVSSIFLFRLAITNY